MYIPINTPKGGGVDISPFLRKKADGGRKLFTCLMSKPDTEVLNEVLNRYPRKEE
jgi:hypothetical protein